MRDRLGFGLAAELAETGVDGPAAMCGRVGFGSFTEPPATGWGAVTLLNGMETTRGSLVVVDVGAGVETDVASPPPGAPGPVVPEDVAVTWTAVSAVREGVDFVGVIGCPSTGSGGPGICTGEGIL